MKVISRQEAREQKSKRYFTGKPCPKNHVSPRRTSSGDCIECGNESSRNYQRRKLPAPTRPKPESCELCNRTPKESEGQRGLHLDHDHATGEFRGWLCGQCNTSLGKLGDSVEGILRTLKYLQTNSAPSVRPVLPTDADERNKLPLADGMLDYFPLALAEVAKVSFIGNNQHNPGQPMHWARMKSRDHANKILKHLIDRGTIDTDGLRHSAKIAWRALALLQQEMEDAGGNPGRASRF